MASSRTAPNADSPPARIESVVARQLAAQVKRGQQVTVALSGGIDSIVLLELLRRMAASIGYRLRALHVNHGISPNARAWEAFCRAHCRRRRIPFRAVRVALAGKGANVEAEARAARYRAFVEFGTEVVALAHNRDDQAETVLLALVRGAGARGLAAMPAARALAGASRRGGDESGATLRLIRPLLGVSRAEIEAYARQRRLRWVDDESNADERFARNFLRRRVLPLLARRFPNCAESIARSAEHLAQAAALLDQMAAADCSGALQDGRLDVRRLRALDPARAANVLRYYLASCGEPPPATIRTREILRQVTTEREDAQPAIELQHGVLRRFRGWLELVPSTAVDEPTQQRIWHGESCISLSCGGELHFVNAQGTGVSAARLRSGPVSIRSRQGGERMRLQAGGRTRTLKNLLREAGVAPWQRAHLPMLFCGDALVWVPGVGIATEFRAKGRERGLQLHWKAPGER